MLSPEEIELQSLLGNLQGALRGARESTLEAEATELWDRVYTDDPWLVMMDARRLAHRVLNLNPQTADERWLQGVARKLERETARAFDS